MLVERTKRSFSIFIKDFFMQYGFEGSNYFFNDSDAFLFPPTGVFMINNNVVLFRTNYI